MAPPKQIPNQLVLLLKDIKVKTVNLKAKDNFKSFINAEPITINYISL